VVRKALVFLLVVGCSANAVRDPGPGPAATPARVEPHRKAAASIVFIEDNVAAAAAKARRENKILFVDAWAPWCHTCLSMKRFVLDDPSLRPLAESVVFAAIDTDKPENAPFLERYAMRYWPTFFVIDPGSDRVLGYWAGAASPRELRALVDDALVELAGTKQDTAGRELAAARRAHAAGDFGKAAPAYARAAAAAEAGSTRKSAALVGWLSALAALGQHEACARVGAEHIGAVTGAATPADYAGELLRCADKLPKGQAQREARAAAIARLGALTAAPPEGATVDDRADALELLADGLASAGDPEGSRRAHEKRLALLEGAARAAPSPEIAATFDYGRATSYVALGRADEAITMLEERRKQLPSSYDPPARLAGVLAKTGRHAEALAAVKRAIELSYGPRRLRYVALKADIEGKMGDAAARLATLREEVAAYEKLPPGHANPARLGEARKRLEEALKAK
jgi:thiol-disulfide isomerase/thioredoxin